MSSYEKAQALIQQEPERQFLQERIRQLKQEAETGTGLLVPDKVRFSEVGLNIGRLLDRSWASDLQQPKILSSYYPQ